MGEPRPCNVDVVSAVPHWDALSVCFLHWKWYHGMVRARIAELGLGGGGADLLAKDDDILWDQVRRPEHLLRDFPGEGRYMLVGASKGLSLGSTGAQLASCFLHWKHYSQAGRRAAAVGDLVCVREVVVCWKHWVCYHQRKQRKKAARARAPVFDASALTATAISQHDGRRFLKAWHEWAKVAAVEREHEEAAAKIRAHARGHLDRKRAQQMRQSKEREAQMLQELKEAAVEESEYLAAAAIQKHFRGRYARKSFEVLKNNPFERVRKVTKVILDGSTNLRKFLTAAKMMEQVTENSQARIARIKVTNEEAVSNIQMALDRLKQTDKEHDNALARIRARRSYLDFREAQYAETHNEAVGKPPALAFPEPTPRR